MLEFKRKWKNIDDLHAFLNDIRLMDSGFGTFVSYAPTFFAKVNLSSHFSYLKKKDSNGTFTLLIALKDIYL